MYFTIVSIIQGVALGTLLIKTSSEFRAGGLIDASLLAALGLLMIVYVWFAYITAGITYGWEPSWVGSFLPFVIGFLESAIILSSSRPVLMFGLFTFMAGAGVLEHLDMLAELRRTDSDCPSVLEHEIDYQKKQVIVCSSLTLLMAATSLAWHSWPQLGTRIGLALAAVMFALLNYREHVEWKRTLERLDCDDDDSGSIGTDAESRVGT